MFPKLNPWKLLLNRLWYYKLSSIVVFLAVNFLIFNWKQILLPYNTFWPSPLLPDPPNFLTPDLYPLSFLFRKEQASKSWQLCRKEIRSNKRRQNLHIQVGQGEPIGLRVSRGGRRVRETAILTLGVSQKTPK